MDDVFKFSMCPWVYLLIYISFFLEYRSLILSLFPLAGDQCPFTHSVRVTELLSSDVLYLQIWWCRVDSFTDGIQRLMFLLTDSLSLSLFTFHRAGMIVDQNFANQIQLRHRFWPWPIIYNRSLITYLDCIPSITESPLHSFLDPMRVMGQCSFIITCFSVVRWHDFSLVKWDVSFRFFF